MKKSNRSAGGLSKKEMMIPLLVLFTGLAMVLVFFFVTQLQHRRDSHLQVVAEQRLLGQLEIFAVDAVSHGVLYSNAMSLDNLVAEFEKNLALFRRSEEESVLLYLGDSARASLQLLDDEWVKALKLLESLASGVPDIRTVMSLADDLRQGLPGLVTEMDQAVSRLVSIQSSPRQIYLATRQLQMFQRVATTVSLIAAGDENMVLLGEQLAEDLQVMRNVLNGLQGIGPNPLQVAPVEDVVALEILTQVQIKYEQFDARVTEVSRLVPALFANHGIAEKVVGQTQLLEYLLESAVSAYQGALMGVTEWTHQHLLGAMGILLILFSLGLFVRVVRRNTALQLARGAAQNENNRRAVLRLLDEMSTLAEGDLTVHATVTEAITGNIADSVNYAIDTLRDLVIAINRTVVQVSNVSSRTQSTAIHLSDASRKQVNEIAATSSSIGEMAETMARMSENARGSQNVALSSIEIANKGADVVRRNIDAMDGIREQIQETSKRIKRLGESSQEIGDIIGLINEIADRTNILSLNAAIQASTAGEAGRGFAVVADEVQRLAERAGDATRQIETLVKAIQADTNEAIASMEQSTSGVVSGAKLAEDAGSALAEVEAVSQQLAGLIQNISSEASDQAEVANTLSRNMNAIREITVQTSDGTAETAGSIGKLTELASELRESVAGFQLPADAEQNDPATETERGRGEVSLRVAEDQGRATDTEGDSRDSFRVEKRA